MCPDGINGKNISSLNLADRVSQDKVHSFFVFLRADLFKCGASCVLKNLFPRLLPLAGSAWPTLRLPGTAASGSPPCWGSASLRLPPLTAADAPGPCRGGGAGLRAVHTEGAHICSLRGRMTSGREELAPPSLAQAFSVEDEALALLLGPPTAHFLGDPSIRPPSSGRGCPSPSLIRVSSRGGPPKGGLAAIPEQVGEEGSEPRPRSLMGCGPPASTGSVLTPA